MRAARTALAALILVSIWTCDRPTPVAPAESGLSISANPTRIGLGEAATITVIARKVDGNPVNKGTEIIFATTLGTLNPEVATTTDRGVATTELLGGDIVGTATITASSGAAAEVEIDVQVGSLASSITLQANPTKVSQDGGKIRLVATVRDDQGNRLRDAAVNFLTEAGLLASGGAAVDTNAQGEARDTLTVKNFDLEGLTDGFFSVFAQVATTGGTLLEAVEDIELGGFPESVSLSVSPSTIPSTGGTLSLIALVRTDGGDAAEGVEVNFLADIGSLSSGGRLIQTDANGQAFDSLTVTQADLGTITGDSFNVSAEAAGAGGDLISSTRAVAIQGKPPVALFSYARTTGTTIQFTDLSSGEPPLSYEWDFESDAIIDSTQQNPVHDYGAFGTFTATLTVTNDFGSNTVSAPVEVSGSAPEAFFTFVLTGTSAKFTNATTGEGPITYQWDFENDGTIDSTEVSPTHDYLVSGNYNCRLVATNQFGNSTFVTLIVVP